MELWNKKRLAQSRKGAENRRENAGMEEKNVPKQKEGGHSGLSFHSTWDIIEAAERGLLPDKVMLNTHPQRWDDRFGPWVKELVWQNVKNVVKRIIVRTPEEYAPPLLNRLRCD